MSAHSNLFLLTLTVMSVTTFHPVRAAEPAKRADGASSAEAAVPGLLARYASCLDRRESNLCAQFFTENGGLYYLKGREAIAERLASDNEGGPASHTVENIAVMPDGPDKASVTSEMVVIQKEASGKTIRRATYRYLDKIVRENGGWLFTHREPIPIAFKYEERLGKSTAAPRQMDDRFEPAARQLIAAYAECIDTKKPPSCVADLFAESGSLNRMKGKGAITALVERDQSADPPFAQVDTNAILHQDDSDRGTAVTDAMFYRKGDGADMIWPRRDRYFDQFVRVNGAWRFAHREIVPVGR